jgi:hypothetical protein
VGFPWASLLTARCGGLAGWLGLYPVGSVYVEASAIPLHLYRPAQIDRRCRCPALHSRVIGRRRTVGANMVTSCVAARPAEGRW